MADPEAPRILVVGATGQLGTAAIRLLVSRGNRVRALVRASSDHHHLISPDVEIAFGDLRDRASVCAACQGMDAVIATATVIFPRGPYSFIEDEGKGYENLVWACRQAQINRLVFISTAAPAVRRVPTLHFKRLTEMRIQDSGIPYTIFRSAPFMDDYFALMGSSLPLRGTEAATLHRPFWLSRTFVAWTGNLIDEHGVAVVPGSPDCRHSFIAIKDVASFLVAAAGAGEGDSRIVEIGGPEPLTWRQVVRLYEHVLGHRVRILPSPAWMTAVGALALRPFSVAAANQLGVLWALAKYETVIDGDSAAREFGVSLTSAEEFLHEKVVTAVTSGWVPA